MKTWLISELFYPEETGTGYFMTQIANKIAENRDVNIICAPFNYETEIYKANYLINNRIKIHRVKMPSINKNKLIPRIFRMFYLTVAMGWKAICNIKRGDKVIIVTNPASLLVIIGIFRKFLAFKYIVIIHDLFPENLIPAKLLKNNSILYRIILKIFQWAYQLSDHIIVVGDDMKELIEKKVKQKVPVTTIQNWADAENIYPLDNIDNNAYYGIDLKHKIIFQFAGNIGRVQGLERLFEIIKDVKNESLAFIVVGEGALKKSLLNLKQVYQLDNIHFISAKPRTEQCFFLNACSIGIVSLSPRMFGLGVPSKTYNIFSAGKPVFYIGDKRSEISRYIHQSKTGWAFSWEEKQQIINFFESLDGSMIEQIKEMGRNARKLVESRFTKSILLDKYKITIDSV
jgi:glycosyltransferase involved in cell wall biosynthesis